MHVGPCRGTIYFPARLQSSPESACKDSNHRSETLNKCEEATPIKIGNSVQHYPGAQKEKQGDVKNRRNSNAWVEWAEEDIAAITGGEKTERKKIPGPHGDF